MLEAHGVHLAYGRVRALAGVDLEVAEGEAVALVGPNGAGKSSLLRVLAGLIQPQHGIVRCAGADTASAQRRVVAYCPDQGALYPGPAGAIADGLAAVWPGWDRTLFGSLTEMLSIPLDRPATAFSKGEAARQRIVLTLCRSGCLLLLDEPLAGVDLPSREAIARVVAAQLACEPARAMVVATHDVRDVESIFNRVVLPSTGQVDRDEDADALRIRTGGSVDAWLRGGVPA